MFMFTSGFHCTTTGTIICLLSPLLFGSSLLCSCISELDHGMDRRSHESPMDFEWQTQPPADVTSPFYQLSQRHGQRRE